MSPINVRINDQNGLIMRGSIAVCFSAMWRIETLQTDKKRSISCQLVPLGVRAKLSGIAVCQCKNVPNQMGISWCARHAECRPYELHYVRLHVAVTPRHRVIEYGCHDCQLRKREPKTALASLLHEDLKSILSRLRITSVAWRCRTA
jgi:hypothetical protein